MQTDRPGLQKLLQNAGTYNGVFIYNMGRLSRSVPDAIGLVRQLTDLGTKVYAPDRDIVETAEEIMEAVSSILT